MTTYSNKDKAQCADREAKYRRRVYPRWVADGRMTQKLADWQLGCMDAIAEDYRQKAEQDDKEGRLL